MYIEGSHVIIFSKVFFPFSDFVLLANSAYSGEMSYHAAFDLGLYCLPKYLYY